MAEYNFLCSRWAANKVIIGKLGEKEKNPIKLEICSIWEEGNWITLKICKSYGNMIPKKQAEVHKSKKKGDIMVLIIPPEFREHTIILRITEALKK